MTALYLTEQEVGQLVDMKLSVEVMEEAFHRLADDQAVNVPRTRAISETIIVHTMSAVASYLNLAGWKCYTTTRTGARFLVGLCDAQSGELMALLDADYLSRLRTGATSAVAAEWMALPEASEMGLFGTGRQAQTQLEGIATVRTIKQAFVYSRKSDNRATFAAEMSQKLGIDVVPVDRPQDAAEDLPIVVTSTNSPQPVFDGSWIAEGTFVCAVGSNWPGRAEIDDQVISRASNIVCDSVECCRHEAGDFTEALQKGIFDWSRAVDLEDVVAGRAVGRSTPESVTLFKSVGMAIEDVALGGKVLQLARERGIGRQLPL